MNLLEYFSNLKTVREIRESSKISLGQSTDEFNIMLIASDFYNGDKSLFVVLPNLYEAQKYYDQLTASFNEEDILFFPADELVSAEIIAATGDFLFERINTISTLLEGKKKIIITNMHGAIKYEMHPSVWKKSIFRIDSSMSFNLHDLCYKLVSLGYEATFTVQKTGQFSRRGSIIDIFPLGYENPIRLDFFGDDIDSIKEFNVENQRSINNIDNISVLPVSELIYNDEEFKLAKSKIFEFINQYKTSQIEEDMFKRDLFDLENHKGLESLSRYIGFFDDTKSTVFSFVENKRIYIVDPIKAKEGYNHMIYDLEEYSSRLGGYSVANMNLFSSIDRLIDNANVLIEALRSIGKIDKNVFVKAVIPYQANKKAIVNDLVGLRTRRIVVLAFKDIERFKKIQELLEENNIFIRINNDLSNLCVGNIYAIIGSYPSFEMDYDGLMIINDSALFDSKAIPHKAKYKSVYKNAVKISNYDELVVGDYVVHYDHGIGKYLGIKTIRTEDVERDFLYVMYGNNSGLYIPLEQISNIMKYAAADTMNVKLHEIGSTAWARAKAKVRKKVHDISDKLIALYAERQMAKGFEYPEDSVEQAQFEQDFEYELTHDQEKAINAIKHDMESKRPMDRLVCGDVGYGKTEVAMRAAFKAVYAGKQVCMLAPTTILARQHYLTFKSRMEKYGIRVELLSRFVSAKAQTKIIEDLFFGGVDIVVGTHRVLSNEIMFKDLGLLIVDEEQRFGVTHKEKIKEMKVNVDCITLTATPIPRTLQMSVMGIKDLSMIETPPKNRYPIQTYVLERNDRIIQDAILRELARGGQIFYLYNRVDSIEDVAAHLHSLVPEARIGIGHGKLSKDQLENVIAKFIDKEFDILLCTTIIETGIDMPDTNTLLIHDADRLGLAQMYQIRGRVGRSNKIAYAYLMYEPRKMLTPDAEKRLETIKEFNELGSGYKIAMRDLSIRGSGDILGEEQSGFIETVGLDMYLKILDEEINKKNSSDEIKEDKSLSSLMTNRTIKESYINNDDARIKIHKKIDKLKSLSGLNDLVNELTDRFGSVDDDLLLYMHEKLMKSYCKILDIYKLDKSNRRYIAFIFTKDKTKELDGNKLFTLLKDFKYITLTHIDNEVRILLEIQGRGKLEYFKDINNYLNMIVTNNHCKMETF